MSDTPENQGVATLHSNQRVGWRLRLIVVMFSLVTGTLMAGLIEAFNTSELMARQLYRMLSPGMWL